MWKRLEQIKRFDLHVSKDDTEWQGTGDVVVLREAPSILVFQEKGSWVSGSDQIVTFHNTLRFRWNTALERISIEHLRLHTPVFLVDLVFTEENLVTSITPHLCGSDTYQAQIRADGEHIFLSWQVVGPKKNERIKYTYS